MATATATKKTAATNGVEVKKKTRLIETEWWTITPEKAQEMLYQNKVNRKIRPRTVSSYAEDMKQGLWRETGEAIKISRTGQLLDGQHRLSAIMEAGVEQEMMVITGLPDEAQALMDQGAVRSANDVLEMEGFKYATLTATVARWVLLAGEPGPDLESKLRQKSSTARVLKTAQEFPDITEAAARYSGFRSHIPASPTAICYTWLYLQRIDSLMCEEFFAGFVDLSFKALRDPRKAGLRALQRIEREDGGLASKYKGTATVSVLTRCWNDFRENKEVETYALRGKGGRVIPPVRPV